MSFASRLKHAYNAFTTRDRSPDWNLGTSYASRPDLPLSVYNMDSSIVNTLYNIISIDVAATPIRHIQLGENGRFEFERASSLNDCLEFAPNKDQSGRAFIQDIVHTCFEYGAAAVVPVDTDLNPRESNTFEIKSMRVGYVTQWYPDHVKVRLYNDRKGEREELILPKRTVAIVQNPFYEVMNKPNSTLQRLAQKLTLLDVADKRAYSGKLDIIIQLPYTIKSEGLQKRADARLNQISDQLTKSTYGIAYADGTEKITQLNRPAESNLLAQIQYLTKELYARLGVTENVFNGTAKEEELAQYWNRTVEPMLDAISIAFTQTFLTKTARTQGQRVKYLKDPFRQVPPSKMISALDTLLRDEVISSNEGRSYLSLPPAPDDGADALQNANINPSASTALDALPSQATPAQDEYDTEPTDGGQNGV